MTAPASLSAPILAGPLRGAVWRLAWPVILSTLLHNGFGVIDMFWVGRLNDAAAQGAMGVALFVLVFNFALVVVHSVGALSLISQTVGAGRSAELPDLVRRILLYAVLAGLAATAFWRVGLDPILRFMQLSAAEMLHAQNYLGVLFLGIVLLFVMPVLESIFRAVGDTRTPLAMEAIALCCQLVLNPLLILGWGPFPAWGTFGAGVATLFSRLLAVAFGLWQLQGGRLGLPIPLLVPTSLKPELWWKTIRIGLPQGTNVAFFALVYTIILRIAAQLVPGFGEAYVEATRAALGIGIRGVETLSFSVAFGFQQATATVVGQNLGNRNPERAEQGALVALAMAVAVALGFSLIFGLCPGPLARLFNGNQLVWTLAAEYIRIVAYCQIFQAAEIALIGVFTGSGNTLPPMFITVPLTAARIPAAYLLALQLRWGASGIFWAVCASAIVKGILMAIWFRRGHWKTYRVV